MRILQTGTRVLIALSVCACIACGSGSGAAAGGGKDARAIDVTLSAPHLVLIPATIDFGEVEFGLAAERTVTIDNTGNADLTVTRLDVTLSDAKAFSVRVGAAVYKGGASVELAPPLVIAPGVTQAMTVVFSSDAEKHNAVLQVHSNDAHSPAIVPLAANQNAPCLQLDPVNSLAFGFVPVGTPSKRTLKLTSTCAAAAELAKMTLQNDAAHAFSLSGPSVPIKLALNQSTVFDVTCQPPGEQKDAAGNPLPFTAQIVLTNNTLQPMKAVSLECYGSSQPVPTPVIAIDEGSQIEPQQPVHLHAGGSFEVPDKQITKWLWELNKAPEGALGMEFWPSATSQDVEFGVATAADDFFGGKGWIHNINVAGLYEFKLSVWDETGVKGKTSALLALWVLPSSGIHVELLWDTPGDQDKNDVGPSAGSDMDLHLADAGKFCSDPALPCYYRICKNPLEMCPQKSCPDLMIPQDECPPKACPCQLDFDKDGQPDPWFHSIYDCFWFNPKPDWGNPKTDKQDPRLDLDDTDGWGPENMNVPAPVDGADYEVGVHYWDSHGYGTSTSTVNLFIWGELKATWKQPMVGCDLWWVKRIAWPSGDLLDVPGAQAGANGKVTAKYNSAFVATLGGVCGK